MNVPGSARQRDVLAAMVLAAIVLACAVDALLGGDLLQHELVVLASALAAGVVGTSTLGGRLATGLLAVSAMILGLANQVTVPGDYPLWNEFAFFAVVLGAPALAGRAVAERARQLREVTERTRLLERQRADDQRAARIEEQARVEAGVQRAVVQRMGAIALQAAGAERTATTDPERTEKALVAVENSARAALDELREVLGSLRAPPTEPPPQPVLTSVVPRRVGPLDVVVGAWGLAIAVEAATSALSRGPVWANVMAALGMTVPLVWRRTWPLAAVTACTFASVVMAALLTPPDALVTPLVPLLLAPFALTAHASGVRRLVGLGLLGVSAAAMTWLSGAGDGFVPVSLAVVVATAAGWVWNGRARRVAQLSALEEQLRAGAPAAGRLAAAERREAIARELHDVVAHAMTVVCLHSAGARRAAPNDAAAAARTMVEVTRAAMEQLRRALEELDADGAPPACFDPVGLVATAHASGTPVTLTVRGRPRPATTAVTRTAQRTLQEALTNAARHAPGAAVEVTISWEPEAVAIDVRNRPAVAVSPLALGSGSGLAGLRERVRSSGGNFEAGPTELGFDVHVRLPLPWGSP